MRVVFDLHRTQLKKQVICKLSDNIKRLRCKSQQP